VLKHIVPFPPSFPDQLASYYEQATAAAKKHHDTRRHLFLNFLRESFNVDPVEVELEQKVKVGEVRGRIDALFRHIIIEVKTDFEREREDAQRELKKYFASRTRPSDYIGIVTDGRRFESWHLDHNNDLASIGTLEIKPSEPLQVWRWLDQFLSSGIRRIPTSDELVARFGTDTAVFNKAADRLFELYQRVEKEPLVAVKFREWNALLAKVYGSPLGKPGLFINHTYLTLISRIVVTLAFKGGAPKRSELRGLMDGTYFVRQMNLRNLAEPDFFAWPLDTNVESEFITLLNDLFKHFAFFDFARLSEDVLKHLYQELVDPETRHDLGEYYTPDWLAELTLERLNYKGGRFLDPACGSGGFLFAAVNALRKAGVKDKKLVGQALENIIGIDVHPVAVLMSKANLLLALRHELPGFGKEVTLRVYMADTLMAEEDVAAGVLKIAVHGKDVFTIPFETIARGELDTLVDFLSDFASRGGKSETAEEKAWEAVKNRLAELSQREIAYWRHNFRLMLKLDKERRNTIWAYILKNAYRPEFLRREKVDYIGGNPPWLSYRYIKEDTYKARVKALTFEHGLLERDEVKLFTQMDTSTLFVAHCEREFLRPRGKIGMVLPKTAILPAKQHLAFQRKGFTEVHDFTDVEPLFNVRTCMIIRHAPYGATNIPCFRWAGKLRERNLSLDDARKILTCEQDTVSFDTAATERSPYYDLVANGATLFPRSLCFVEPMASATLNLKTPFIRSSDDGQVDAKKDWRLKIEGRIERVFLYASFLSKDLLPFAVRKFQLVALPVVVTSHGDLKMVDANEALSQGFKDAHDWFAQVERIWTSKRRDKNQSFAARLDYDHLLTRQNPKTENVVVYNSSGMNLSASVVTQEEVRLIHGIETAGFFCENIAWRYYARSKDEAHYLVGVLNSRLVNEAIKPYQPQGLMGERHIHRRPFEACNIPLFDSANELQQKIARVAAAAREELVNIVPKLQSPVAQARAAVRDLVAGRLAQLEQLTRQLLGAPVQAVPRRKISEPQGQLL
jgi:SAM-dependent methyltransferase